MIKFIFFLLIVFNVKGFWIFDKVFKPIHDRIHKWIYGDTVLTKFEKENIKIVPKTIIIKEKEIDSVWKKNYENNTEIKKIVQKTSTKICIENEFKLLINKKQKNKNDYKEIFKFVKQNLIKNCKNLNEKKHYEDISLEMKEFLVTPFIGKKSISNLDFIISNFKKKKLYNSCEKYLILQVRDLYFYLLEKGFGLIDYQTNFITLLNYLKKYNKFDGFKTIGIEYFSYDYKVYIPFLLGFINFVPSSNFKKLLIIKTQNIVELIKLLKKSCNEYFEFKNSGENNLEIDEKKIFDITELVFTILLIKNRFNTLGKEYFPDIFYKLLLKYPIIFIKLIRLIDQKGDDIFEGTFLNYNFYNLEIKSKISAFLKKSIFIDIREKFLNTNDSLFTNFNINQKKLLRKSVISIISTYNNHFYFLKKVFKDEKSEHEIRNNNINLLFNQKISLINDGKVKTVVKEFANFIFYDDENLITKKFKRENDIHTAFVDILIGETEINENIVNLIIKNSSESILENINSIYLKVIKIKEKKVLNNLYQNFMKVILISLFKDERKMIKKYSIQKLTSNTDLLLQFLDNATRYNVFISDYVKLLSSSDKIKIKFNFKGIYNPNKLPKTNSKDENYYIFEIIGYSLFKHYVPNYYKITKNFTENCSDFIDAKKRINVFSKIIGSNNIADKHLIDALNILIDNNVNIFLRRTGNEDQKKKLQVCPESKGYEFDLNKEIDNNIYTTSNSKSNMGEITVTNKKTEVYDLGDFDFRRR